MRRYEGICGGFGLVKTVLIFNLLLKKIKIYCIIKWVYVIQIEIAEKSLSGRAGKWLRKTHNSRIMSLKITR